MKTNPIGKHRHLLKLLAIILCFVLFANSRIIAQSYGFDVAGRLTRAAYANGSTVNFLYDDAGNLSSIVTNSVTINTNAPTVNIVSPNPGSYVTNALLSVLGIANSPLPIASVFYQVNDGAWNLAATADGNANWTGIAKLVAGINTLSAYAQDALGSFSVTNTISFLSSSTFDLQLGFTLAQPLTTNGLSLDLQLSPGLNGRLQVSTNLSDWTTLTNFGGSSSTINLTDTEATNSNQRFYRAVIP